jgi:hypothetical protein
VPFAENLLNLVFSAMWTAEEGALTQLYASVSKEVISKKVSGLYFHPITQVTKPHYLATKANQLKLWKYSEKLLKSKGY